MMSVPRARLSLLTGLFLLLAAIVARADPEPPVETFTLDNGMQVVVIPDHRAPVVTHMVWYRVGSADEPQGKDGVAHFLEHLMFKGTKRYPPGAFSRIIRKNGGEENAFTSKDYTCYFQHIAKDRLDLVMDLEADRMQNLELDDGNVASERDVVLEERRARTDNEPSGMLVEQLDASMYLVHPYHRPVIGWMEDIKRLNRADAIDFYRAHYTPGNAVLIVAGDVTAAEVRQLAEKHYGKLKNTVTVGLRERAREPDPIAARRVSLTDPRVASPSFQRAYLAPSYSTADGREALALEVLAQVLGGNSNSRLYQKLVVDQKIAAYAGAWYSGDALDWGSFGVYGGPNPGGDVAAVEVAIDAALAEILEKGITPEELARAKNTLIADTVYSRDSQSKLARIFGTALVIGESVDQVVRYPKEMAQVTADEVLAAARKVIDLRRSVTGLLLPAPGSEGEGMPEPAIPSTQLEQ
jgi:zinc protease